MERYRYRCLGYGVACFGIGQRIVVCVFCGKRCRKVVIPCFYHLTFRYGNVKSNVAAAYLFVEGSRYYVCLVGTVVGKIPCAPHSLRRGSIYREAVRCFQTGVVVSFRYGNLGVVGACRRRHSEGAEVWLRTFCVGVVGHRNAAELRRGKRFCACRVAVRPAVALVAAYEFVGGSIYREAVRFVHYLGVVVGAFYRYRYVVGAGGGVLVEVTRIGLRARLVGEVAYGRYAELRRGKRFLACRVRVAVRPTLALVVRHKVVLRLGYLPRDVYCRRSFVAPHVVGGVDKPYLYGVGADVCRRRGAADRVVGALIYVVGLECVVKLVAYVQRKIGYLYGFFAYRPSHALNCVGTVSPLVVVSVGKAYVDVVTAGVDCRKGAAVAVDSVAYALRHSHHRHYAVLEVFKRCTYRLAVVVGDACRLGYFHLLAVYGEVNPV